VPAISAEALTLYRVALGLGLIFSVVWTAGFATFDSTSPGYGLAEYLPFHRCLGDHVQTVARVTLWVEVALLSVFVMGFGTLLLEGARRLPVYAGPHWFAPAEPRRQA